MRNKLLASLLLSLIGFSSANAQSGIEDFYRGKQITLIVGYPASGGYALYARILANHLGKHVPGNPRIITQFMPGAGGTRAANFLYAAAPKDGTALGALGQELGHFQALGGSVKYDAVQFLPIGRMTSMNSVVAVWHTAGVRSIEEAKQKEIVFGTTGASSQSYTNVMMMKNLLGYKFRATQGYDGGPQINLAMERGEIQARIGDWNGLKTQAGHLLESGKLIPLAEIGLSHSPDLKVPLVIDLAKNDENRSIMRFLSSSAATGRTIYLPPGTPQAQVNALRKAFDSTMKDPEFLKDAAKARADLEYMSGSDIGKLLKDVLSVRLELIARAKAALKD